VPPKLPVASGIAAELRINATCRSNVANVIHGGVLPTGCTTPPAEATLMMQ
jgi:hypothetical protein